MYICEFTKFFLVESVKLAEAMRVVLLFAFVGAAIAVPRRTMRIVGGTPTTVDEYPYMCNMRHLFTGVLWYQACGGSLITVTSVLSAAHCYEGDLPLSWRVRVGTTFASTGGTELLVSQLALHERYNRNTLDNDVAIVRLTTPAVLSPTVQLVRIAGPNFNPPDGATVRSVGWGTLTAGGWAPEQLQHVEVHIINHQLCVDRYAYLKTQPQFANYPDVTPGMLCAGILDEGGRDACQGDSGGPLAYSGQSGDVIVGVTSWGFGCAHEFYPGVNARISYYSDWISTLGSSF